MAFMQTIRAYTHGFRAQVVYKGKWGLRITDWLAAGARISCEIASLFEPRLSCPADDIKADAGDG